MENYIDILKKNKAHKGCYYKNSSYKICTYKRLLAAMAVCLVFAITLISGNDKIFAASNYIRWEYPGREVDIIIEQGKKFYLGDYIKITDSDGFYTGAMVKGSYSTSNKKIATISKKGLVSPRKAGQCDLTFRYKGKSLTATLTVIKAKTFEYEEEYLTEKYSDAISSLQQYASTLKVPSKITNSNVSKMRTDLLSYRAKYNEFPVRFLTDDGVAHLKKRINTDTGMKDISNFLAVPSAGRYLTLHAMLYNYMKQNDPLGAKSAKKLLKLKSVKASGSEITVTLKKAPTEAQIMALKLKNYELNPLSTPNNEAKAIISVHSSNGKKNTIYTGIAILKKGQKNLSIELSDKNDRLRKPIPLVKGNKYEFTLLNNTVTSVVAK